MRPDWLDLAKEGDVEAAQAELAELNRWVDSWPSNIAQEKLLEMDCWSSEIA